MPPTSATTDAAPAPDGSSAGVPGTAPIETLWAERAEALIDWFRPWDAPCLPDPSGAGARWFPGARLNASWNCLDRHLERHGDRTALIWEGDDEGRVRRWSFAELHERTCRFANALTGIGVRRGDRVCLYLPVIPEAVVAMLACARIGAVHAVVYAGFSPDALRERLRDAGCSVVVTADCTMRANRRVPLKANADLACEGLEGVRRVVVVRRDAEAAPDDRAGADAAPDVPWNAGRDLWYHDLVRAASERCAAVEMEATDPLFVLYTSGSTGKPKGVVHATGGYLVHVASSCRDVFGHADGEVHWCAADLGWITAHSYAVYGPLANATTTLLHEGVSTWPDAGRWWRMIERHRVNVLYTSPTALRGIRALGDAGLDGTDRSSLRLLGTVGEPVDRDTWRWYAERVGEGRCRVVDTWWQTETGGIVVASDPDAPPAPDVAAPDERPRGAAMRALDGLLPELVDERGDTVTGEGTGELVLGAPWPGQAATLWNDHERYVDDYLARHPGRWATGDGARRDADGRWWLTGRLDDVLTLSGRRVGAAEIEALLMGHPDVAEAAAVGRDGPDGVTQVAVWVRPRAGAAAARGTDARTGAPDAAAADALRLALEARVRDGLGRFAVPERIRLAPRLPKTRSGKLMRRMLRKIAERDFDDLGDITTLADPSIVDALVADELAERR